MPTNMLAVIAPTTRTIPLIDIDHLLFNSVAYMIITVEWDR